MAKTNIRRRRANKRAVIFAAAVMLIIAAIFLIQAIRMHRENEILRKQKEALEESLVSEEELRAFLEENKDKELSREELIALARERFGLVFPEEILFLPEE